MTPLLENGTLRLLPVTEAHADIYIALINLPTTGPRLGQPLPYERHHFDELLLKQRAKEGSFIWMIENNGKIVGGINSAAQVHPQRYQGGYWVHPDVTGNGIATEALTMVRDFLFREHNATRIQAVVEPDNLASIRVLEKCGYVREGLLRRFYPDRTRGLIDVFMYAIIR